VHKLLARQLKRSLGTLTPDPQWASFVEAVDTTYQQYDADRQLLERSLELTSEELMQRYKDLQSDLERRLAAEAELATAREIASLAAEHTRLADMRARFLTQASHEFRTPLTVILATSEALSRYDHRLSPEDRRRKLTNLQTSATRLTQLLNEILTVSQTEARDGVLDRESVDIVSLCYEATLDVAESHQLKLEFEPERPVALLDPVLLRQIVGNLVDNAAKYSAPKTRISVLVTLRDDVLKLRVEDEGIGIPDADRERLFEPFFRCDNASNVQGVGLGLTSMHRAVLLHGGTVSAESQLGVGSTFTVTLPSKIPQETASLTRPTLRGEVE
jgi:signal transduction histidine kinase